LALVLYPGDFVLINVGISRRSLFTTSRDVVRPGARDPNGSELKSKNNLIHAYAIQLYDIFQQTELK
jgi:hypothetical protein